MKVTPAETAKFKPLPLNPFSSDPIGALNGDFGGEAACAAGFSKIWLESDLSKCDAAPKFVVTTNGRPREALLPGTIMLPNTTLATLHVNEGCPGGYGAQKVYYVRFGNSAEGANPDFNTLPVRENLNTKDQPNSCNLTTAFPMSWTIGTLSDDKPAPSNTIDDGNGKCFPDPITCTTVINQSFTIGSCTTPTNTITLSLVDGAGTVTRSDEGGQ